MDNWNTKIEITSFTNFTEMLLFGQKCETYVKYTSLQFGRDIITSNAIPL